MRNRHKNLNEEIIRMKSLFTEERLYGNLVEITTETKKNIMEQARPFQSLKRAFSLGLKSIDPKILTRYINFKVDGFGDLVRHLDEFDSIWKAVIPSNINMKKINGILSTLDNLPPEKIAKISWEDFSKFIDNVPKEGGLRETVYDLFNEIKTGTKVRELNPVKIEIEKVGDEVLVTTKKGDEVVQYKKNNKNEFEKVDDGTKVFDDSEIKDLDNVVDQKLNNKIGKNIPEGSDMSNLNGKTFEDTPENVKKVDEAADEAVKDGGIIHTREEVDTQPLKDEIKAKEERIKQLEQEKIVANEKENLKLQLEIEKTKKENLELQKELKDAEGKPKAQEGTEIKIGEVQTRNKRLNGVIGYFILNGKKL